MAHPDKPHSHQVDHEADGGEGERSDGHEDGQEEMEEGAEHSQRPHSKRIWGHPDFLNVGLLVGTIQALNGMPSFRRGPPVRYARIAEVKLRLPMATGMASPP